MGFRFRLGPFTFGRSGTRLSLWSRNAGVSIPLTGKKSSSFGKIGFGPFKWFFGGAHTSQSDTQVNQTEIEKKQHSLDSHEEAAIKALKSNWQFLEKLQQYGLPWRGVQEHLKENIPEHLVDRNKIAYLLVPKAMNTVFGQQNVAWKTEKRPSKGGSGLTTWVVIIKSCG